MVDLTGEVARTAGTTAAIGAVKRYFVAIFIKHVQNGPVRRYTKMSPVEDTRMLKVVFSEVLINTRSGQGAIVNDTIPWVEDPVSFFRRLAQQSEYTRSSR